MKGSIFLALSAIPKDSHMSFPLFWQLNIFSKQNNIQIYNVEEFLSQI